MNLEIDELEHGLAWTIHVLRASCVTRERMSIMAKTPAQLDREIKEALAKPVRRRDPLVERIREDRRARRGEVLRAIRSAPVAVVMIDRNGRETLAIVTREMSRPEEGAWRASVFWRDGPVGHVTRKTLGTIASELAEDYSPTKIRVVDEADVIAWTSTDDFAEGARKVAEVQAWNEGRR